MTKRELVLQLIAATPAPPAEADCEHLLVAFHDLAARRATLLASEVEVGERDRPTEDELALLGHRDALWRAALDAARDAVGGQRVGAAKLRAYASGGAPSGSPTADR